MSTLGFSPDQLLVAKELSDIIRQHNETIERLAAFRTAHPHLVAPNLIRLAEENLKENVSILYRELNSVHKPRTERRRHVCRDCHNEFVVPLPGGICDECKSKLTSPPDAYAARPHKPEAEAETEFDLTPVPEEEPTAVAAADFDNSPDTETEPGTGPGPNLNDTEGIDDIEPEPDTESGASKE